ncbi:MAG: SCO family protein [Myxococcales bacterium]|nr:SCO family protein [Myxococcales bacterium]
MRSLRSITAAVGLVLALGSGGSARAAAPEDEAELDQPLSPEMRAIEVTDRRGERVDTGLRFVDHQGQPVVLADFFDGERPVAFTLNYYRCRVVCSVQLTGLADALAEVDWVPGQDFRLVTVSIDPHETAKDARKKRAVITDAVGKGDDLDWAFLTGDELNIRALAAQLGIGYAYDAEQDQYAHPGVVVFLTPDGRVSRYVYGLTYDPLDVKLGLYEAGDGKIGGPVEQLYLSCFSYDATIGRYGPFAMGIMRLGGSLTAIILGIFLFFLWRRERRHARLETMDPMGSTAA